MNTVTDKTAAKGFMHGLIGGVGAPIAENPTGVMMEAAFEKLGLQWRYLLIECAEGDLDGIVAAMKALRFIGGNFTVPHKVAIIDHLDELAESARLIGAVNTVRLDANDRWVGENTDGVGFMLALAEAGIDPKGKRIAILGAGGAARAIGVELALAGVNDFIIVNRTPSRAEGLIETLSAAGAPNVQFIEWRTTFSVPEGTDILVQATSIGLGAPDQFPDIDIASIQPGMTVCDVIPNPPNTALLKVAAKRGARTMDGLSMIVNQAAIALKLWSGMDADRVVMRGELEKGLGLK